MIPLKDTRSSGKIPFVSYLLIAINVFVFVYTLTLKDLDLELFFEQYALIPAFISQGKMLHTFLTSLFLHGGFVHLLGNMVFLNVFGDRLEAKFGHLRFIFFFMLFGVLAAFFQFVINPCSQVPNLGASGAIAGLMGAYLCLFPRARIKVLVPVFFFFHIITLPAFLMLGYWFLIQALSGVGGINYVLQDLGGVAYFAHIGGFLSGFFITRYLKKNNKI